jgi:hypothetical protein
MGEEKLPLAHVIPWPSRVRVDIRREVTPLAREQLCQDQVFHHVAWIGGILVHGHMVALLGGE